MVQDPEQKIARPRQVFTGPARRDFVPLTKRNARPRDAA
jgi:citrate synthase